VSIHLGPLDLSINKAVAYLLLGSVLSILIGIVFMRVRLSVRPGVRQTIGEQIYEVAQTQIAEQGLPSKAVGLWFPYVATLFIFIWVLNMIGFVPLPLSDEKFHLAGLELPTLGIYAATASLSVTLALSLMTWVFTHIEGVRFNGPIGYLKSLIPEVPKAMVVPIALIEFISVFMRLISLSVRLFANMLAGHMLILVMIGLVFVIHTPPWRFLGLPAAFIFYAFEVVIVVSIQAFIFAALSAIYIGSAIEPEH
jgi:F-type H+-transporting ATPase subunit a